MRHVGETILVDVIDGGRYDPLYYHLIPRRADIRTAVAKHLRDAGEYSEPEYAKDYEYLRIPDYEIEEYVPARKRSDLRDGYSVTIRMDSWTFFASIGHDGFDLL